MLELNITINFEWMKQILFIKQHFQQIGKNNLTNRQAILKLNQQLIKADHVLVEKMLENHSKPKQLQTKATYEQVQSFFTSLKQNYQEIQSKYINSLSINGQSELRKGNQMKIQAFIKDEKLFFQKVIHQNLIKTNNQQQKSIKAIELSKFIKDLFKDNPFLLLLKQGENYLKSQRFVTQTQTIVKNYIAIDKQLDVSNMKLQDHYIVEHDILDFLTYWLSDSINLNSLHIVYARTQSKLNELKNNYIAKCQQNQIQLKTQSMQILNEIVPSMIIQKMKQTNAKKPVQMPQFISSTIFQLIPNNPSNRNKTILSKANQNKNSLIKRVQSDRITKQQQLQKIIPQLFTFACKIRATHHKGTTFDDILSQSKHMNLEKFINLCIELQMIQMFNRQYLIEMFKLTAINRLHLDFNKFQELIKKLNLKNSNLTQKIIEKAKIILYKKRTLTLGNNLKEHAKIVTKYNYQVRPLNGKDVESIQQELKQRKRQKQQLRQQKDQLLLKKRQGAYGYSIRHQKTLLQRQKLDKITNYTSKSKNLSIFNQFEQSKINSQKVLQKFNPEDLITNLGQQDKLWEQYEQKIWKKDKNKYLNKQRNQSFNQSILEEALEKRIQKGNKVLNKIASTNLKYYI